MLFPFAVLGRLRVVPRLLVLTLGSIVVAPFVAGLLLGYDPSSDDVPVAEE